METIWKRKLLTWRSCQHWPSKSPLFWYSGTSSMLSPLLVAPTWHTHNFRHIIVPLYVMPAGMLYINGLVGYQAMLEQLCLWGHPKCYTVIAFMQTYMYSVSKSWFVFFLLSAKYGIVPNVLRYFDFSDPSWPFWVAPPKKKQKDKKGTPYLYPSQTSPCAVWNGFTRKQKCSHDRNTRILVSRLDKWVRSGC